MCHPPLHAPPAAVKMGTVGKKAQKTHLVATLGVSGRDLWSKNCLPHLVPRLPVRASISHIKCMWHATCLLPIYISGFAVKLQVYGNKFSYLRCRVEKDISRQPTWFPTDAPPPSWEAPRPPWCHPPLVDQLALGRVIRKEMSEALRQSNWIKSKNFLRRMRGEFLLFSSKFGENISRDITLS